MSDEAALLAAIAAHPDEDTPRLAYADWLDEHHPAMPPSTRGKKRKPLAAPNPRAELIRAQIELARRGDDDTSTPTNALRDRVEQLLREHARDWTDDFGTAVSQWVLEPTFRRGFPDLLGIPACLFVQHGAAIRRTLPTLTSLSVYRLNGWGRRFAQSPHLRGLRELKVSCWVGTEDVIALAKSPNLKTLDRLTIWRDEWRGHNLEIASALGRSRAWPNLKQLTIVWDDHGRNAARVNQYAGRALAVGVDRFDRTFHFAEDFDHTFFVGRLPDERQVFASCPWIGQTAIPALLFDAAGKQLEQLSLPIPAKHVLREKRRNETWPMFADRRDATFQQHREQVRKQLGAEPADIRVRQFLMEGSGIVCGIGHFSTQAQYAMFQLDDPDENFDGPYGPQGGAERGIGGLVEPWLGDHGWFTYTPAAGSLPYIIGGRGRIVGHDTTRPVE